MNSLRGPIIGGLIGGVIGMVLWAIVGIFTGREVGLVAWFVGVFVGAGVKSMAKSVTPKTAGMCAAAIAFLSVVGGKFMVAATASLAIGFLGHAAAEQAEITEADCIADMCWKEASDREDAGETLAWPEEGDPGDAYLPEHFPTDVRRNAESTWADMSPLEKKNYTAMVKAERHGIVDEASNTGSMFVSMFGPFDILWTVLAVGCAFKMNTRDAGPGPEAETETITPPGPSFGPLSGMPPAQKVIEPSAQAPAQPPPSAPSQKWPPGAP